MPRRAKRNVRSNVAYWKRNELMSLGRVLHVQTPR